MKIIPEFNIWLYQRYFEGQINEIHFEFPTELNREKWYTSNSVINLLFNDTFSESNFEYLYREIDFYSLHDNTLINRLSSYRSICKIYNCISSEYNNWKIGSFDENVFEFNNEEINLLNLLFTYRSTGTFNSTITYQSLSSNLSKLIFIYLRLMIYNDIDIYNNDLIISNPNRLIEVIFEKYLIDTYFKIIKNNYLTLDSETTLKIIELHAQIDKFELNQNNIYEKRIQLSHLPKEISDLILTINGINKILTTDYNIYTENENVFLTWDGLNLETELQIGSKLYITYPYENKDGE